MAADGPPHGQAPGAELPAPAGPDGAVLDVYNDGYGAGLCDRPGAGVRREKDGKGLGRSNNLRRQKDGVAGVFRGCTDGEH